MTTSTRDQIMWSLAGLTFEGSPVGAVPWDRPPAVEIDGDRLRWSYARFAGDDGGDELPVGFGPIVMTDRPVPTTVRLGILFEFVNLTERNVEAIAAFASRWGVLHLCRHELPRTHPRMVPPLKGDERRDGPFCQTVYGEELAGSESLGGWVWWARRARSILRITAAFAGSGKKVDLVEEWGILLSPEGAERAVMSDTVGKTLLGREVEAWLRAGAVQPRINLLREPRLRIGGWELFGVIALQLASVVTAGGVTFCHECGDAYLPTRQPVAGRRNYCGECRKRKIPQRDAARDSRERPAEARRTRMRRASPD